MNLIYNFCPKCGHKYGETDPFKPTCDECGHVFYQNSKPTASTLILNDQNQVLLGRRAIDPSKGKWDVIGGFLNLGEHPTQGAIREAKEETGLDVKIEKLLGIFMDTYGDTGYSTLNICYTATVVGGEPKPNDDAAELKWFDISNLPDDMAYKNNTEMLKALQDSL